MDTTPLTPGPLRFRRKSRIVAWFDLIMTFAVALSYLYLMILYVSRKPDLLERAWIVGLLVLVFVIQMVIYLLRLIAAVGLLKATKEPNELDAFEIIRPVDNWIKANLLFMLLLFLSCFINLANYRIVIPQVLVILVYGIFHFIVVKYLKELKRVATDPGELVASEN